MFEFPERIQINVRESPIRRPIPNLAVRIHLSALQRNDYHIILPVSDSQGNISITQSWVIENMQGGLNQLLADQSSPLDDLYPQIEFEVMTGEAVDAAIKKLSEEQQYGENLSQIDELSRAANSHYLPIRKMVDLNNEIELKVTIEVQEKPLSKRGPFK